MENISNTEAYASIEEYNNSAVCGKREYCEVGMSFDLLSKNLFQNSGISKPGKEVIIETVQATFTEYGTLNNFREACQKVDPTKAVHFIADRLSRIFITFREVLPNSDCLTVLLVSDVMEALVIVLENTKPVKHSNLYNICNALAMYNNLIASPDLSMRHFDFVYIEPMFKIIIELFESDRKEITNQCLSITDNICRDMGANRDAMVNLGVIGGMTKVLMRCAPNMVLLTNLSLALSHATSSPQTTAGFVRRTELRSLTSHLSNLLTTELPPGRDCEGLPRDDNAMCKACACEIICQITSREGRQDIIDELFVNGIPKQLLEAMRSGGLDGDGKYFLMGGFSNMLLSDNSTHIDTLVQLDGFFDALGAEILVSIDLTEHGAINVLRNLLVGTSDETFDQVIKSGVLSVAQAYYKDKVTDDNIHICFAAAFRSATPEQLFILLRDGCFLMLFGVLANHVVDEEIVSLVLSCLVCAFEKLDDDRTTALEHIQPPEWRDEVQYWQKQGQDHEVQELAEKLLKLVLVEE